MNMRIAAILVVVGNLSAVEFAYSWGEAETTRNPVQTRQPDGAGPGVPQPPSSRASEPWKVKGCATFASYKTGAIELRALKSRSDHFAAEMKKHDATVEKLDAVRKEMEEAGRLPESPQKQAELKRLRDVGARLVAQMESARKAGQELIDAVKKTCPDAAGMQASTG